MKLTTTAFTGEIRCDKCKQIATPEKPVLEFYTTCKARERNWIQICQKCLNRELTKAIKKLNPLESGEHVSPDIQNEDATTER